MGRLIDSDVITDFMLEHNTPDSLFASVEEIVAYQPTAFDVEEVVNVVREAGAKLCCNKSCNNNCDCCVVDDALRDIIDAIRKGGVKNE